MNIDLYPSLLRVRASIPAEEWDRRVREADQQAGLLQAVRERMAAGQGRGAAIREVIPEGSVATWLTRLSRFETGGRDALIGRRIPVVSPERLTPEIGAFIQGLLAVRPELRSREIVPLVREKYGLTLAASTVRYFLRSVGQSHPVGRPKRTSSVEALPLAGAELLKAIDTKVGATAALAHDLAIGLALLPEGEGETRDDRANRDGRGRFLKSYNGAEARRPGEPGRRFRSVAELRVGKDLRAMRTANSTEASVHRKVASLVLLPVAVQSPRWEALSHWQGDRLGGLVGVPYQARTLDKFTRELKYAGLSDVAMESVAHFWLGVEGQATDPVTGAVVVYVDTTVKPLWTHYYARSTKVAKLGGRVMPATSTAFLHSGAGTPLLYRGFSGHASLVSEALALLRSYEELAGPGTARRLVVIDREADSVGLFKALTAGDWLYVIPLRGSVTGPNARFEGLTDWAPYGDKGDAVREGRLLLQDSRPGEEPLWSRVVGRRRHRTGKIAWYATNAPGEEFGAGHLIDVYFGRWPCQEHVFRDANGVVGLDVHHGYGKQKIQNVAVLGQIERLEGSLRRHEALATAADQKREVLSAQLHPKRETLQATEARVTLLRGQLDGQAAGAPSDAVPFEARYQALRQEESALEAQRAQVAKLESARKAASNKAQAAADRILDYRARKADLARKTEIYTIDTELDQILLAFKLTFLNLCHLFLTLCCPGQRLEVDTLLQAIFTLPGERLHSPTTETIRIYRQPRDRDIMLLVEEACRRLTDFRIVRKKRRLVFELVDRPGD
jgi:hypothetical protein